MAQYIDKDALVEEINTLMFDEFRCDSYDEATGFQSALEDIKEFIETLEVKEMDLESEQRMRECPCRQVVCTMYEGKILECKGACSWVVDYPKLKELKTQKGK